MVDMDDLWAERTEDRRLSGQAETAVSPVCLQAHSGCHCRVVDSDDCERPSGLTGVGFPDPSLRPCVRGSGEAAGRRRANS
jgi:hypothetical protein